MNKSNCVFCKIANGEIPSVKVWEDENFIAFLDVNPYAKGHLLVVPKHHSEWVWDIDDKNYLIYMKHIKYFANILRKAFDTDWVEEVIAGIGISHSHVHLLPRKRNDGLGEIPTKPLALKPSEKEMNEIAEKIRGEIR